MPKVDRERLLKDVHSGTFASHFSPRVVYDTRVSGIGGKRCIGTHKRTVEDVSPVHHMTELEEE